MTAVKMQIHTHIHVHAWTPVHRDRDTTRKQTCDVLPPNSHQENMWTNSFSNFLSAESLNQNSILLKTR